MVALDVDADRLAMVERALPGAGPVLRSVVVDVARCRGGRPGPRRRGGHRRAPRARARGRWDDVGTVGADRNHDSRHVRGGDGGEPADRIRHHPGRRCPAARPGSRRQHRPHRVGERVDGDAVRRAVRRGQGGSARVRAHGCIGVRRGRGAGQRRRRGNSAHGQDGTAGADGRQPRRAGRDPAATTRDRPTTLRARCSTCSRISPASSPVTPSSSTAGRRCCRRSSTSMELPVFVHDDDLRSRLLQPRERPRPRS